ncbi:secreted glycosidase [Trichophyton mentagrophytes]|nr:secreted glycosidase [Trichophyton mentagrophytes]
MVSAAWLRYPSLLTLGILVSQVTAQRKGDVLRYVDQLVGTANGGHAFPGASLPYGMAKAVADVDGSENYGGFTTEGSNITGFSHMHDSGTGGKPSMGNFPLVPQICQDDDINKCKFSKEDRAVHYIADGVKARPGYFAIKLNNGIAAEMTVTEHAALYHFDFPHNNADSNGTLPVILVDLTDIQDSRQNAAISLDENTLRVKANGTFLPSFGIGTYNSFVCVDFSGAKAKDTGVYISNRAGTQPKAISVGRGFNLFYIKAGAYLQFQAPSNGPTRVSARVGLSFVNEDQACKNAEKEIPGSNWDFEKVRTNAESAWKEKLALISLKSGGVSDTFQRTFWSAIYRTMISPQDYTGENPLWQSKEPYFDSFYCLWDSFRSQIPLLAIIDPSALAKMIRSLLDTYKHQGWLPDCRMSLCKGFTQSGSNADVVIADAYVKNITDNIDWDLAYEAVVKDAEVEPSDWSVEGRGGLMSWKSVGYIPAQDYDYLGTGITTRSISRTVEYSYNDYCVGVLGKGLGKEHEKYFQRSGNWQNLFKADQTSFIDGKDTGFVGFFQPRYYNGTWGYQDPILCSNIAAFCSLTSNSQETYESGIWENQFFVPHDMSTLINLLGGRSKFVARLDYLHDSNILYIGNEPSFLATFLYHYAGRPALSAKRAHTYIPSRFNDTTAGVPGNDDSGAMGSFTVFAMMGLFPNPGQDVYFIMPPFFESVSIKHPVTGKTATVRNVNFDSKYENVYIQRATLNGKEYTRNWIGHEFFLNGGTLELTLGKEESSWGTGQNDVPPSLGAGVKRDGLRFT